MSISSIGLPNLIKQYTSLIKNRVGFDDLKKIDKQNTSTLSRIVKLKTPNKRIEAIQTLINATKEEGLMRKDVRNLRSIKNAIDDLASKSLTQSEEGEPGVRTIRLKKHKQPSNSSTTTPISEVTGNSSHKGNETEQMPAMTREDVTDQPLLDSPKFFQSEQSETTTNSSHEGNEPEQMPAVTRENVANQALIESSQIFPSEPLELVGSHLENSPIAELDSSDTALEVSTEVTEKPLEVANLIDLVALNSLSKTEDQEKPPAKRNRRCCVMKNSLQFLPNSRNNAATNFIVSLFSSLYSSIKQTNCTTTPANTSNASINAESEISNSTKPSALDDEIPEESTGDLFTTSSAETLITAKIAENRINTTFEDLVSKKFPISLVTEVLQYDQNQTNDIIDIIQQEGEISDLVKSLAGFETVLNFNAYPGKIKNIVKVLEIFNNVRFLTMPAYLTETDLESIAEIKTVSELDLTQYMIKESSFNHLARIFPALETLHLGECEYFTTDGFSLSQLALLTSLKSLDLHRGEYNKESLVLALAHIPLQSLRLDGVRIADRSLADIAKITSLKSLQITECNNISDQGIDYIEALTNLESLYLETCAITEAGLMKLAGFKNLNKLCISAKDMTDEDFDKAREINPELTIIQLPI